jgi:uncharacterized membrane protein
MDAFALARALHVLGVVVWIGGVAMVTTVILPLAARSANPAELTEQIERRFAWQARAAVLLVGVTGFYMTAAFDLWDHFASAAYWWMHAMVGVWLVFAVVLFVAEPLFLHRWFSRRAERDPLGTLRLVRRAHWVLLIASLVTVFGAVAGSHGWFLF